MTTATAAALIVPIDTARALKINQAHRNARNAASSMLSYALEAGRELLEVKKALPHGQFGDWCRENLEFHATVARDYMRLAKTSPRTRFEPDLSIRAALEAISEKPAQPSGTPSLDKDTAEKLLKLARMANSPNENEAIVAQEMVDKIAKRFAMTGEEAQAAAEKLCPAAPQQELST